MRRLPDRDLREHIDPPTMFTTNSHQRFTHPLHPPPILPPTLPPFLPPSSFLPFACPLAHHFIHLLPFELISLHLLLPPLPSPANFGSSIGSGEGESVKYGRTNIKRGLLADWSTTKETFSSLCSRLCVCVDAHVASIQRAEFKKKH